MPLPKTKKSTPEVHQTKKAYGLIRQGGGYSVVTYEITGDKATEIAQTDANLLQIAFGKMQDLAYRSYVEINA